MYAKYFVSGAAAAFVDLGLLFMLTEYGGLHYLFSVIGAFVVAFVVSFVLQKFWTFRDHSTEGIHGQLAMYLVIALINLGLNTLLVYVFADMVALHMLHFAKVTAPIYLSAQALASILLAVESFFVSRYIIFRKGNHAQGVHIST